MESIISIAAARNILRQEAHDLTDEQILTVIEQITILSNVLSTMVPKYCLPSCITESTDGK